MTLADEWFTEYLTVLQADRARVRAARRELVEPIAVTLQRRREMDIERDRTMLRAAA